MTELISCRYRVIDVVARGGMGVVYHGEDPATGEAVAIKTVRVRSGPTLDSIRREIHALRRVRHPGIVRILDDGVADGVPWYAMPLLQGRTLREHLDSMWHSTGGAASGASDGHAWTTDLAGYPDDAPRVAAPPVGALDATLTVLRRLCAPLAFLHGEGLVHRDLKPENIFLQEDGRPVLVDLGIAARFGGAEGREELCLDWTEGTVGYMAPEQIQGELVDARADLYALGCILYECATGRRPFAGESRGAILRQHLYESPVAPSLRVPGLLAELDRLVLQLLQKRPQDRLGYAADVAAALGALGAGGPPDSAPPARAYLYRPEITGRADALAALEDAIVRVQSGRGGMVLLRGESGVGKTRVALEVARIAADRSLTVLTGRCVAPLAATAAPAPASGACEASAEAAVAPPLRPLRPVLLAAADRARDDRAEADRLIGPRGKVLAAYEPALLDMPGQEEQPAPASLRPDQAKARVITAVRETLWALSERSPVVLLIDDLQWADELSLSALESLAKAGTERRSVLVVATYRSEETRPEIQALEREVGVRTLALGKLDKPSVAAMVSGMLALRAAPPDVLEALVGHSNGNPFFVAEYLRAAIGEEMLRRDEGGSWRFDARGGAAAAFLSLPLPHTLAELIERRLVRLAPEEQALAAWGAVLGQELDGELLLAGAWGGPEQAMEALEALRVREILEEGPGGRLQFAHDKLREIAYQRLSPAERSALHLRAAEALEARLGEAPDAAAALGHHYANAGLHAKAGAYYARAAARAFEVHANGEAIRLYRAAIAELTQALADMAPPSGASALPELYERLGDALSLTGDQGDAREAYTGALEVNPEDRTIETARLHRKIGKTWEMHQFYAAALESYDEAEAFLLRQRADDAVWWDEWVQIQIERISVYYWQAELDRIRERVDAIRPAVERSGPPLQRARFFHALTQMSILRERYEASSQTVRWAREGYAAATSSGDGGEMLTAECGLAMLLFLRGAFGEAEQRMTEALRAAEETGDLGMQARCLTYQTVIHRRLRRSVAAGRLAERGIAAARAAGMGEYIGACLGNLAWLALERGDLEGAERAAREAIAQWEGTTRVYPFQWLARLPLARVELKRGRVAAAVEQAKAVLDGQQQRLKRKIAADLERAGAALDEGRMDRARSVLERALMAAAKLGYA